MYRGSGSKRSSDVGSAPRWQASHSSNEVRKARPRGWHAKPLVKGLEPVWNVMPEELADEWALDIADGFTPEKICCIDRSKSRCPQVSNGCRGEQIAAVVAERHVA